MTPEALCKHTRRTQDRPFFLLAASRPGSFSKAIRSRGIGGVQGGCANELPQDEYHLRLAPRKVRSHGSFTSSSLSAQAHQSPADFCSPLPPRPGNGYYRPSNWSSPEHSSCPKYTPPGVAGAVTCHLLVTDSHLWPGASSCAFLLRHLSFCFVFLLPSSFFRPVHGASFWRPVL